MANDYRFREFREKTETDDKRMLTALELSEEFKTKGYYLSRDRIASLENKSNVIPNKDDLKAYCDYFHTTSDYLLNLRDVHQKDEDKAMIGRVTGLSGDSIEMLKQYKDLYCDILNYLITSNALWKLIKVVAIDASLDTTDNNKNDDYLSYREYATLRTLEHIIKELFRNEILYEKISKYRHERIDAIYGKDDAKILEMPEPPE